MENQQENKGTEAAPQNEEAAKSNVELSNVNGAKEKETFMEKVEGAFENAKEAIEEEFEKVKEALTGEKTAQEAAVNTEIDPNSGASTNAEHDSATANGGTVTDLGEEEKKNEDEDEDEADIPATSMEAEANDAEEAKETAVEEEIERKLASGEPPAQR